MRINMFCSSWKMRRREIQGRFKPWEKSIFADIGDILPRGGGSRAATLRRVPALTVMKDSEDAPDFQAAVLAIKQLNSVLIQFNLILYMVLEISRASEAIKGT